MRVQDSLYYLLDLKSYYFILYHLPSTLLYKDNFKIKNREWVYLRLKEVLNCKNLKIK